MRDSFGRTINYMRISVTDRCNLRCIYCMPKKGVQKMAHGDVLTFEEIIRVTGAAAAVGIETVKITGGEPLVRKNIADLIGGIKQVDGIRKVTMTTNGVLFDEMAEDLAGAGLDAVNFSLDTLDADRFERITRIRALERVLKSIDRALDRGLFVKINCVPMRAYNMEDLTELAGLAKLRPLHIRFIEMMPIGAGKEYTGISNAQVLRQLAGRYGRPRPCSRILGNGPAKYYDFPEFMGSIGLISAMTNEFCGECNRVRLTADGKMMPCLCSRAAVDFKRLLRQGICAQELAGEMKALIACKPRRHHMCRVEERYPDEKNMIQIGG